MTSTLRDHPGRLAGIGAVAAVLLATVLCASAVAAPKGSDKSGRYIVVLKDSVEHPATLARSQARQREGKVKHVYRHALKGYAAVLPKAAVAGLRNDPRVDYVTRDHKLKLFDQTVPTGVERVFATENDALDIDGEDDVRVDVDVAVIDTGVDDHVDLDVVERTDCADPENGFECVDGVGDDYFGHGTHVAGTVGAIDNGQGVVGVAPGARIWSVRVYLSSPTELFESSATAGVDWVASHSGEIEVANLSFGCTVGGPIEDCEPLTALESAISSASEEGVVFVAAAGNDESDAAKTYPASHPDVVTVSALADYDGKAGGEGSPTCKDYGPDDNLASFSNYGETVDVAAPGVCILSTFPEGQYGYSSGTSMAAPHVAGAAAVIAADDNPDNLEDVEAIRAEIVDGGNFDWEDTSEDGEHEPLLDVNDEKAPAVMTEAATEIEGKAATLNATVNPRGSGTTYQFEYGTSTAYGAKAPTSPEAIGSGGEGVEVSEEIEGLESGTTYHFRIVATNSEGTAHGEDMTFTTAPLPIAWTLPATLIGGGSAKLNAYVGAGGELETTYQFQYGPDTSYGSSVPAEPKSIGTDLFVEVSELATGLEPNTTYHFRVVATNEAGTSFGEDLEFTTEPYVVVEEATLDPCPPVSVEGGAVSGGCLVEEFIDAPVSINGSWGCDLALGDMRIGGDGRLYTYDMQMYTSTWCGAEPCQGPWLGQIKALEEGQSFAVELEVCFDAHYGPLGTETVTMSLDRNEGELKLSQSGYSEDGNLLHGGEWATGLYDFTIEVL